MEGHIEENALPKNIRQIGYSLTNEKIYIEDYVMTYIKQLSKEPFDNEKILILIGQNKTIDDIAYTFINGLLEVDNVGKYTELLENEQIIRITNQKEDFFEGRDIVGLGIISTYEWLKFNEDIHEYFASGLVGDTVLIYDVNHEEIVYRYNGPNFVRKKGYYIYYDRNESMQNYMLCMKDGKSIEYGYATTEIIDKSIDEKIRSFTIPKNTVYTSKNIDYSKYKNLFEGQWGKNLKYCGIVASLVAVLIIGVVKIDTFEKITRRKANQIIKKTESIVGNKEPEVVDVNTVAGNVSTQAPNSINNGKNTENNDKTSDKNKVDKTELGEEKDEKKKVGNQKKIDDRIDKKETNKIDNTNINGQSIKNNTNTSVNDSVDKKESSNKQTIKHIKKNYYIVKKGDALVDISRKMYGTIKKVDSIKRANGIEDENKIYIGQKLWIP